MARIRNIFLAFGIFWISLWIAGLLAMALAKVNDHVIYQDGAHAAVQMGVMSSLSRILAAVVAGALITILAEGLQPHRWSVIIAGFYIIDAPVRHH